MTDIPTSSEVSTESIITLLGVGYAGTDFIEAFMRKAGSPVSVPPEPGAVP